MNYRRKLFKIRDIYNLPASDELFLAAMRQNIDFHIENSEEFRRILGEANFSPASLRSMADIADIPILPTMFLKKHSLFSVPENKLRMEFASSGTSGAEPSRVGLDSATLELSMRMVVRTLLRHSLITPRPANYIVLGYEPSRDINAGAVKTAYGMTFAAPALHREYALRHTKEGYELNLDGIRAALLRYEKQGHPVRFMGFPAYFYFLLQMLEAEGISLRLNPKSKVFLHGGWKQFHTQKQDKGMLYEMAERLLGIGEETFHDFYGPVEHPIFYADCPCHHFHVPVYSRVIIRDIRTLEPLPYENVGLVNLISPHMCAMPYASIMPDDLGVMYPGEECPCGNKSPWFVILGRVGLSDIRTCAANAGELLAGIN